MFWPTKASSDTQGNIMSTSIVHLKSKKNTSNIQVDDIKGVTQNGRELLRRSSSTSNISSVNVENSKGAWCMQQRIGILGCVQLRGRLSERSKQAEMRARVQAGDGPKKANFWSVNVLDVLDVMALKGGKSEI